MRSSILLYLFSSSAGAAMQEESGRQPAPEQLQFYEVRDLLGAEDENDETVEVTREGTPTSLFRTSSSPTTSSPGELLVLLAQDLADSLGVEAQCQMAAGALVVRAGAEVHERLQALLLSLRRPLACRIGVQVQVIDGGEDLDRWLIAAGLHFPVDALDLSIPYECDADFAASLLQAVEALDADVVAAPQLTVLPLQRANLSMQQQESFVRDYEELVVSGGQHVVDPQIETIGEGFALDLRAVLGTPDEVGGAACALALHAVDSRIERPIETFETRLGSIQMPRVTVHLFSTTTLLHPGKRLLLVAPPHPSNDGAGTRRFVLLVTVRAVTAPEAEEASEDGAMAPVPAGTEAAQPPADRRDH